MVFAEETFPRMNELVIWPNWFGKDWYGFNKVAFLTLLAVLIPVVIFLVAGSKYRKSLVPRGVQNVAESAVEMVERQVIMPTIGAEGLPFLPLLLSMFLFILFGNLFEIIPTAQFPANARMANPLVLALLSWVVFIAVGVKHNGLKYFWQAINPPGVPAALKLLVIPIELISVFVVRPFSLAIRLFANMLAGHILLVTFVFLTVSVWELSGLAAVAPVTFAGLVLFTGFELMVAFLQAYVFTLLTAVYIGGSIHLH
jgi:F-type H+-transporting ATPase subunit a